MPLTDADLEKLLDENHRIRGLYKLCKWGLVVSIALLIAFIAIWKSSEPTNNMSSDDASAPATKPLTKSPSVAPPPTVTATPSPTPLPFPDPTNPVNDEPAAPPVATAPTVTVPTVQGPPDDLARSLALFPDPATDATPDDIPRVYVYPNRNPNEEPAAPPVAATPPPASPPAATAPPIAQPFVASPPGWSRFPNSYPPGPLYTYRIIVRPHHRWPVRLLLNFGHLFWR
jgi:hypothetical protein